MNTLIEIPASIGQRLVWFLEHYRSDKSSVSCPALFKIRGSFDEHLLEPALTALVERHESLRTTLARRGRGLVQQVHPTLPVALRTVTSEANPSVEEELSAPIPVEQTPVRYTLWRLSPTERVLCINMHHLISDAWSCGIVVADLIALLSGRAPQPMGWQYRDFSQWQHELANTGELAKHQDYWNTKLAGLELPVLPGRDVVDVARPQPALAVAYLPGAVGDGLREFARAERTTLFSVFLSLYYLLLHSVTGQSDLTVASFFANRNRRELQQTVGFLANMLALRTRFEPTAPFRDLVTHAKRTIMDAVVHQAVPTQMLSLPSLLHSTARINDVVFQMLPDRSPESWDPTALPGGATIDTFRPPQALSRFGLNLTIIPRSDRVEARLSYAANQFEPGWADRFLESFATLSAAILTGADQPVSTLLARQRLAYTA